MEKMSIWRLGINIDEMQYMAVRCEREDPMTDEKSIRNTRYYEYELLRDDGEDISSK